MTDDEKYRQGRSRARMRNSYILAFGGAIGLAILSIISMFL